MDVPNRLGATLFALTLLVPGAAAAVQPQATSAIEGIRTELLQLPYYGVFDFIAFNYDKGTVTLMGYAYRPDLKADAVRASNARPASTG